MNRFNALIFLLLIGLGALARADSGALSLDDQFNERVRSVIAVEFFIQHILEREPSVSIGLVLDDEGRAVLLESSLPSWLPPDRFKDFRVHALGMDSEGYGATYLGQDFLTGNHYIQIDEAGRQHFESIRSYPAAVPSKGDLLWGIGVMGEAWAYKPYFLSARFSTVERLPVDMGFGDGNLASPGAGVFDEAGHFVGWAGAPVIKEKRLNIQGESVNVGIQELRESGMFVMADVFFGDMLRIPKSPTDDSRPWLGVTGMTPLDPEVARFLGLDKQGAIVVSDIVKNSPAEKGGLQGRDIIVGINGEKIPKFKPDFITPRYFERVMRGKNVGEAVQLDVIRGEEKQTLDFVLSEQPTTLKLAQREYFTDLGIGIRQFTLFDAVSRHIMDVEQGGVIADFVKPNSLANSAGLLPGDWIKEIDGIVIESFAQAQEAFLELETQEQKKNFVMLIRRNNETKVIHINRGV